MDLRTRIIQKGDLLFRLLKAAVQGFGRDRCSLRASALSLFTLMSIVPVMAMAFGIAKGFGFKKFLENKVLSMFAGQEEVINTVLTFSNNLLERTQGGLMAVLGIILLIYSLVKLMGHMENAFNKIWWVTGDRAILRKITDYITISMAAGLLVIFSGSANIFITTRLAHVMALLALPQGVEHLISFGFKIFPFISVWLLFTFFYIFIPNKKVEIQAALAGGIMAGTIFQVAQMTYLTFQVGVSSYNAIYGSFAALPLFLIWLQASWTILLFGAEIAFAWENRESLRTGAVDFPQVSIHHNKLLMLRVVRFCVQNFAKGLPPAKDSLISETLGIPLNMVRALLEKLVACSILFRVDAPDDGYTPARDIECLTVMDVVTAFEKMGEKEISLGSTLEVQALEQSLGEFEQAARRSPGERNLKDI